MFSVSFLLTSLGLGLALSMDAFSISLADGLCYPHMKKSFTMIIPISFAFFQLTMPLLGWFCIHTISSIYTQFEKLVPVIAIILLLFIGGKMLLETVKPPDTTCPTESLSFHKVFFQGVASSLDALSVGFTISSYSFASAFLASSIIACVTFLLCSIGLHCGKLAGLQYSRASSILGGSILILIAGNVFISNFLR